MDEHRHDDSEGDHEVNSMSLGGLELRGLNSVENDSWVEVVSRRAKRWGGVNMGSVCAVNHTGCHPKGGHKVNGEFEEVAHYSLKNHEIATPPHEFTLRKKSLANELSTPKTSNKGWNFPTSLLSKFSLPKIDERTIIIYCWLINVYYSQCSD